MSAPEIDEGNSHGCCYLPSDDPTVLSNTSRRRETLGRTRTLDRGPLAEGPHEGPFNRAGIARGTGPEPDHGPAADAVELSPDGPLRSVPTPA